MLSQIPLQTYLSMLMLNSASSLNALQVLRRGSLSLNPALQEQARKLQERIREKNQEELESALKKHLHKKLSEFASVVDLLNQSTYQRKESNVSTVWTEGTTRLFEYTSNPSAPTVLFVPSLINRSYILDLSDKRSFIKWLQKQGINSYLIDWGEPDGDDLSLSLDDYISGRLNRIIDFVASKTGKQIILAGYCMGGLLAMASALQNKDKISSLALFATPWDFHTDDFARISLNNDSVDILQTAISGFDKIHAHIIQSMFYYLHADLVRQKFDSFFEYAGEESCDFDEFVALEYWVNDGISLTTKVAQECFINWMHHNSLAKSQNIGGIKINPALLDMPVFMAMAENDHIVPKSSSMALADLIKNPFIVKADTGHVALVAGRRAEEVLWQPFLSWLEGL